jgi:hypothetical protein
VSPTAFFKRRRISMLPPSGYNLVVRCAGKSRVFEPGFTEADLADFLGVTPDGNAMPKSCFVRVRVELQDGRTAELTSGNPFLANAAFQMLASNNDKPLSDVDEALR